VQPNNTGRQLRQNWNTYKLHRT